MKKTILLWDKTASPDMNTELDCYFPDTRTHRSAIVIFPGGGYWGRAEHEGQGYAEFLNAHGISAFVCQYHVYPHQFPVQLQDARRAIRYVRHYAAQFGIDKDQVYVMGSSAGGHLAALVSTYYEPISGENMDAVDQECYIPNGQILCYPVIKLLGKDVAHLDSGKNLLGDRQAAMGKELSPDLIATSQAPKAFIWHTFNDSCVSVLNSMDYAKRLWANQVEVELHIYPHGEHGLGLAPNDPHVAQWSESLLRWLALYE